MIMEEDVSFSHEERCQRKNKISGQRGVSAPGYLHLPRGVLIDPSENALCWGCGPSSNHDNAHMFAEKGGKAWVGEPTRFLRPTWLSHDSY